MERAQLKGTDYDRVYATIRDEGPPPGGSDADVFARIQEIARELGIGRT